MKRESWQNLLMRSEGMTVPAMISGALSPEEIAQFMEFYRDIFREFLGRGSTHLGLKVFIDGIMNHAAQEGLMASPPGEVEPFTEWTERIFSPQKFGMILNNLEKYSNPFASFAAAMTTPLLELTGVPLGGFAFLIFIGNYGFTPFGVHKDNPGEEGFLFHIGPGEKRLYTWETERFLELSGGNHLHTRPEEILSEAENVFILAPGDIVFLPSEVYHVADTPEFSVSMVMDFVNPPASALRRTIASRIAEGTEVRGRTDSPVDPIRQQDLDSMIPSLGMESEIRNALNALLLRLQSNGGIFAPSDYRKEGGNVLPSDGEELRISSPFRIFSRERAEDDVILFCRGHEIHSSPHPRLKDWISNLNGGRGYSWEEILDTFQPEWDVQNILGLLSQLKMVDGIEVCTENESSEGKDTIHITTLST